jgi:hypothetical protein
VKVQTHAWSELLCVCGSQGVSYPIESNFDMMTAPVELSRLRQHHPFKSAEVIDWVSHKSQNAHSFPCFS